MASGEAGPDGAGAWNFGGVGVLLARTARSSAAGTGALVLLSALPLALIASIFLVIVACA